MKLPTLPFSKKTDNASYYLALVLRNEKVNAVIFEEAATKVKVVGEHHVFFDKHIDDITFEELLTAIDEALAKAEEGLPENIETRKTVFGVKENWVTDGKIKREYLAKLKKVSEELNLEPIGFLTIAEAISHLLQKEEGAPISAVLVETGKHSLQVSLLRAGKVIETKSAVREGAVSPAVDTLLKHFTSMDILPSRIIVFDGKDDYSQEFITHQWSKSLPFLHMPQIMSLPSGFDAKAVLFGAATQMGFTFLPDAHVKIHPQHPEATAAAPLESEKPEPTMEEETVSENNQPFDETQMFGFQREVDVRQKMPPEEAPITAVGATTPITEIPETLVMEEETKPIGTQGMVLKTGLLSVVKMIKGSIKLMPKGTSVFSVIPLKGKKAIALPLVILLLLSVFGFYFFLLSANVLLSIATKTQEKTETLTFATDAATSVSEKVIASEFITVSEDGTLSAPATGKKTIGDKAKGKVTIFNNNDSSRTIASGTTITSSNGLQFTLNQDVTVASAAGDIFSGTKPGTSTVSVTASIFGTEYNLPSDTKFSITGSSTIAAKNDSAFSGGTKKDVTVVGKADEDKLLSDLQKNLSEKAKTDFSGKLGSEKETLQNFSNSSVTKQKFDKAVGDQAAQVTLTATVSYEGIAYNKTDLHAFAKALLEHDLAHDVTLNDNDLSVSIKDAKQKTDKQIEASVTMNAKLLPKIDPDAVTKQIAGKSYAEAEHILTGLPQVSHAMITASPNLPLLPKNLPRIPSHIHITIQHE